MDKILDQVFEWAHIGNYHNYPEGEFRRDNLKILKQVEEKLTSTNSAMVPCPQCKNGVWVELVQCSNCNHEFNLRLAQHQ